MSLIQRFNFEEVDDFDKHIELSIPNYSGLCEVFSSIAVENTSPKGGVYDIGCSTGRFISKLPKQIDATYTGVDVVDIRKFDGFEFVKSGAAEFLSSLDSAEVVIAMFALQFMGKKDRRDVIDELVRLNDGGALILISEKVYFDNSALNQAIYRQHLKQKRRGFTDSEILEKDAALVGSMFCLTESQIEKEISRFNSPTQVWQSYNFKGWAMS